jgi:hypothetical protein
MSESFLAIGDFNVIAVDWGGGSATLYSQSAANTRYQRYKILFSSTRSNRQEFCPRQAFTA